MRSRFRDPLLVQGALAAFVGGICIGLFFLGYRDIPLKLRWTPVAALSFAAAFVGLRLLLGPWLQLPSPGSRGSVRRQAVVVFLKLFGVYVASLGCMLLFVSWVYPLPFPGSLEAVAKMSVLGLAGPCLVLGVQAATYILEAKQALARAEARAAALALQAQLQPHTIFNALNGIIALIGTDPRAAEAATYRLADLLRRILSAVDRESWPLSEELAVVEDLLSIQRMRFGDRFHYQLVCADGEAAMPIPPLLLIPLVENSLKHGFQRKLGDCHLRVEVQGRRIRIEDDGVGRNPAALEGLGLRTVRMRLAAEGGSLEWLSGPGCRVELSLP